MTVDVAAGVAQDAAANGNTAAAQLSRTFDSVNPTVTIASTSPNPTNSASIPVTVQFSKAVADFASGDVNITNGTISAFAGSGTNYSFNVAPSGNGTVTISVAANAAHDAAANGNLAAVPLHQDLRYCSADRGDQLQRLEPTNASPIPFTVTFSEMVTDFTSGDVTIGNGTIGLFTAVSGTTYTFTVSTRA